MINQNNKIRQYIRLERKRGLYFDTNEAEKLLERIAMLFTDQGTDVFWVREELLDPNSRGTYGELSHLSIRGNVVILEPTEIMLDEDDDPENHAVEIGRDTLLRLANEWDALIDRKVPEIFIVKKEDTIFITDTLPAGLE